MGAPGSLALADRWLPQRDAARNWIDPSFTVTATKLVEFLDHTWEVIDLSLRSWTTSDLTSKYPFESNGEICEISRQWTFWRVLSHDIHHGGQICEMLYQQGIEIPELGDQGGHLTEP